MDLMVWVELLPSLITEEACSDPFSLPSLSFPSSSDSLWRDGALFSFSLRSSSSQRPWHWKWNLCLIFVSYLFYDARQHSADILCLQEPSEWICGRREPVTGAGRRARSHPSSPLRWCWEGDMVYSYLCCSWTGRSQTGRSTWWRWWPAGKIKCVSVKMSGGLCQRDMRETVQISLLDHNAIMFLLSYLCVKGTVHLQMKLQKMICW